MEEGALRSKKEDDRHAPRTIGYAVPPVGSYQPGANDEREIEERYGVGKE